MKNIIHENVIKIKKIDLIQLYLCIGNSHKTVVGEYVC